MLLLMKKAGLRTSEALHLKFTDITLNKSGSSYVLKVLGKGNKERRVPINKKLFEPFLLYLTDNKRGVYLSSTSSGAPMKRSNLHAAIRKIFEVAGVERSGLHLLRHDYGSRFAAKNGNMKILQDLLGHAVITTTMIYSHVSDEVMANAVNQLDEKDINA
jgi:site-specific recombinase XerD